MGDKMREEPRIYRAERIDFVDIKIIVNFSLPSEFLDWVGRGGAIHHCIGFIGKNEYYCFTPEGMVAKLVTTEDLENEIRIRTEASRQKRKKNSLRSVEEGSGSRNASTKRPLSKNGTRIKEHGG